MISSVESNTCNLSFKRLILNKSTNKSTTAKSIASQLKEPFPGDEKNRSIVKRAEDNGFDIYLEKKRGYTHVYLTKVDETANSREVGIYNSPDQFDLNKFLYIYQSEEGIANFKERDRRQYKYWKVAAWAITIAIAGLLAHGCISKQEPVIERITQLVGKR